METFDQADSGYPEEGPSGADDGDGVSTVREEARPVRESERAPDNDDGKATGDPST